jgi:hypothetical protein
MKHRTLCAAIFATGTSLLVTTGALAGSRAADPGEALRDSLVYIETAGYAYSLSQPWRHEDLRETWVCGCAVGQYQVVTTARSVANLAFAKALRHGQNEFLRARPKVIDYESDLCLIELDPNELREPLTPVRFAGAYRKGAEVSFHWLSAEGQISTGRGYIDRVEVERATTSYGRRLRYEMANVSRRMGRGEIYCVGSEPLGIGCWASDENEAEVIPGETIRRFVDAVSAEGPYRGFGEVGFVVSELRDPTMRSLLKLPESVHGGVYVSDVHTLGTGSDDLRRRDVILSIDGHAVDARGQYSDAKYGPLSSLHLITQKTTGDILRFEIWREGREHQMDVAVQSFHATDMLVPFHEYDRQPEYVVIAGFVFQTLTREYLTEFGDNPPGQAPSHLYQYYRDRAYKPTPERSDIVVLNYVLPAPINVGYMDLRQMVVKTFNGMSIGSIADIAEAMKRNPESPYHLIELELYAPTVVIPRDQLATADALVSRNYGIPALSNLPD